MKEFQLNQLRNILTQVRPLVESEWKTIMGQLRFQVLQKNEFFLKAGEISTAIAFISAGLMRMFYITLEGQEFNRSFASENNFYGAFRSAVLKEPALFYIQALEYTELITIDYDIINHDLIWRDYALYMLQQLVLIKEKREAQFLQLTPEQRYHSFLADHPGLVLRLSDRHIASYLGITPVSLSRIKKR